MTNQTEARISHPVVTSGLVSRTYLSDRPPLFLEWRFSLERKTSAPGLTASRLLSQIFEMHNMPVRNYFMNKVLRCLEQESSFFVL